MGNICVELHPNKTCHLARLCEQGDKNRIGQYLLRWSQWVGTILLLLSTTSYAGTIGVGTVSSSGGLNCEQSLAAHGSAKQMFSFELDYDAWVARGSTKDNGMVTSVWVDVAESDQLDFENCTYTMTITETADAEGLFRVETHQTPRVTAIGSHEFNLIIWVDTVALKALPKDETFRGEYSFALVSE